jgi:hypothetical protein
MLIQTHRPSNLDAGKPQVTGELVLTQRQARTSAIIEKLQKMTERIISGEEKITDATRQALETIDSEMDSIIANAQQNQQDFQATVDRAEQSVEACGTETTTSHTKQGGINDLAATVSSARTAHSDCRTQEVSLKDDDTTKRNALNTYIHGLAGQATGGSISSCMCVDSSLGHTGFKGCIDSLQTWSTTAGDTWTDMETAATASTGAHTTQVSSCNTLQGTFESDSCSYGVALNATCDTQETCRATQIALRNSSHAAVAVSESAFKAEYESAKHVKCILQVLNATDADKSSMLNSCRDATYDTSHLSITYHAIPSPATCDRTPIATGPCDAAWEAAEYTSKTWHAKAPVQHCTPCFAIRAAAEDAATATTSASIPSGVAQLASPLTMAPSTNSFSGAFTYEAWVKSPLSGTGRREIFGGSAHGFYLIHAHAACSQGHGSGSGETTSYQLHVGYSNTFSHTCMRKNTWYHVAATRANDNVIKLYVNGALTSKAWSGTTSISTGFGGGFTGDGSGIFNARIWSVARSKAQLESSAFATTESSLDTTSGLVAAWPLTENLDGLSGAGALTGALPTFTAPTQAELTESGMTVP